MNTISRSLQAHGGTCFRTTPVGRGRWRPYRENGDGTPSEAGGPSSDKFSRCSPDALVPRCWPIAHSLPDLRRLFPHQRPESFNLLLLSLVFAMLF